MQIKPLHNHVVIKQQDETETMYGNIIVPDAGKEKPLMGEVIASGPGLININGILIPNTVEVGATVAYYIDDFIACSLHCFDWLVAAC